MNKKVLYGDVEPKERLKMIRNLAVKKEDRKYERSLDVEEIDKERFDYVSDQFEYQDTEEEMKMIYAQYKERLKYQKERLDERLKAIRTGKKEEQGTLFLIANHSTNRMEYYDHLGELIESRDLTSDERQGFLFLGDNSEPTYEAQPEDTEKNVQVDPELNPVFDDAQEVDFEDVTEQEETVEDETEQEEETKEADKPKGRGKKK